VIANAEEVWKAWIGERNEGGRKEVDKGSCDENTCSEMLRYEDESARPGRLGGSTRYEGESASFRDVS
jgi:hypothetical protein